MSYTKLSEIDQVKLNKENYEKRLKSAQDLAKIKDSLVLDKTKSFFGVLSFNKKDPKDKKYYPVTVRENKFYCDCIDFSQLIKHNRDHLCKHCLRTKIGIDSKEKIKIIDLTNLLKKEAL